MNEQDTRSYAKSRLADYLQSRGIDTRKNFRCINPAHADRHASMSFYMDRVKCFACGFSGDIYDVVSKMEGLNTTAEAFRRVHEMLGIEIDYGDASVRKKTCAAPAKNSVPAHRAFAPVSRETPAAAAAEEDNAEYIGACAARAEDTDYFTRRGISREIVSRFGLGYDPCFTRGTGRRSWQAAIIPNGRGGYIARNTDPGADDRNRYRKCGEAAIFNSDALYSIGERPVFLVEGEIDALSVETAGFECVALGSVSNAEKFIRLIENRPVHRRIVVCMDADDPGKKCAEKLLDDLKRHKVDCVAADPFGGRKDANEALMHDAAAFREALRDACELFDTAQAAEIAARLEEYQSKYSAYGYLDAFLGEIAADTPCVPTGFGKLDTALGGGLYPGLTVLGAVSSLGKTTFCLQMADHIAASGNDVLIFSLEMGRTELISKSISRITLKKSLASGWGAAPAKSARDITVSARYACYTERELELIDAAIREYEDIARRVYIMEGVGNIGAADVAAQVREHIEVTKNTPVVIVDYLQLLSPASDRLSDKQALDKNILELKRLSRDYSVPVVCISSFSRAAYKSNAEMSAFKESGSVEYSADVLLALQYTNVGEEGYDPLASMKKDPRSVEVRVLKNRNGLVGSVLPFKYYPRFNYFEEE